MKSSSILEKMRSQGEAEPWRQDARPPERPNTKSWRKEEAGVRAGHRHDTGTGTKRRPILSARRSIIVFVRPKKTDGDARPWARLRRVALLLLFFLKADWCRVHFSLIPFPVAACGASFCFRFFSTSLIFSWTCSEQTGDAKRKPSRFSCGCAPWWLAEGEMACEIWNRVY
jgi:hypothetical protein